MMPVQKPGSSRQDYCTPDAFIEAVKMRLGIDCFDADLAASADNSVAEEFYSEGNSALTQPRNLGDGWNWLNPPFSDIAPWVKRAHLQATLFGARTAVLVPASVGSNWWRDWVHGKAEVFFLNGRLQFKGAIGLYPKDCALLLYGDSYMAHFDVWSWKR